MKKYSIEATEIRQDKLNELRYIMRESEKTTSLIAKTIGHLSVSMPQKKKDFEKFNLLIEILLEKENINLIKKGYQTQWKIICESLKG